MLAFEIIFIILFAIYVKYDPGADAYHDLSNVKNVTAYLLKNNRSVKEGQYSLPDYYASKSHDAREGEISPLDNYEN